MESGFSGNKGFDVDPSVEIRKDAYWFGEAQGRIVVSVANGAANQLLNDARAAGIACSLLGTVTGEEIIINGESWGNIDSWKEKYDTAIEKMIQ